METEPLSHVRYVLYHPKHDLMLNMLLFGSSRNALQKLLIIQSKFV